MRVWAAASALAFVLGTGGSTALARPPQQARFANLSAKAAAASAPTASARVAGSAFADLPTLHFSNQNTGQSADVRLYDVAGQVDEAEAARLDALLCDARDPDQLQTTRLNRRTLQLSVRTALHFKVREIQVVSAYRKPGRRREGPHANGDAIDFKLPGVAPRVVAAYLRTLPRVGVGIYTHRKTGFVHLDAREHSFHWLDASPPGRHWREMSIGGAGIGKRDASYRRADDWPEGTIAP